MSDSLNRAVAFVAAHDGINDKAKLRDLLVTEFGLTRDCSVFYCADFAIRFSSSASKNFGNTVASLSRLQKFDDRPFISCNVTPRENHLLLANSTLLKKVSHTSQQLRENNIRGSFNGSDIMRELADIENCPRNFSRLFAIHIEVGFDGNLPRLVEATNNISPTGSKFAVTKAAEDNILSAPNRAVAFLESPDAATLQSELDAKVDRFRNEILLAALIEDGNTGGRAIEYIIAGEDAALRDALIAAIQDKNAQGLPQFKTENALGDYTRTFETYHTETDVKTKIMVRSSNPKAYNIDKILEFLSQDQSVFLFYFVGVDPGRTVLPVLISMFQSELIAGTITLKHWAGRNSRGVTQFEGNTVGELITNPNNHVDVEASKTFLRRLIEL
jgi:hypothetical protein